jgi:hypothetical protein
MGLRSCRDNYTLASSLINSLLISLTVNEIWHFPIWTKMSGDFEHRLTLSTNFFLLHTSTVKNNYVETNRQQRRGIEPKAQLRCDLKMKKMSTLYKKTMLLRRTNLIIKSYRDSAVKIYDLANSTECFV